MKMFYAKASILKILIQCLDDDDDNEKKKNYNFTLFLMLVYFIRGITKYFYFRVENMTLSNVPLKK